MQIKNPSNKAITDVKIYGVSYSIDAEGTLDNVPESHARYWQSLHSFLILRKDKLEAKPEEVVVEVPKPTVEEVVEATPEPVVEVKEEVVEVKEEVKETPVVKEVKTKKVK